MRAATWSMKIVPAFTIASLDEFDERSSAGPPRTQGAILATGRNSALN
jgi:hypothetical protein